jgi:hypothetical protein
VNAIEDLLSDAFEADAQTVRAEDVPALAIACQPGSRRSWSSRMTRSRLVVPLAAAAAVIAVVLGAGLVVPGLLAGPGAAGRALSQRARSALFGTLTAVRPPRYLVGLENGSGSASDVGIYSARTGRLIAQVSPPRPGLGFIATAAARGDLSFVVAAAPRSGQCATWFYQLTLSSTGRVASLTPLAVPRVPGEIIPPSGLTASADGRTVAYTANGCGQGNGWLGVIDLVSHKARTWRADAEDLWSLSLSATGRLVLYVNSTVYGGDGSVQVLRTNARPGALSERARVVAPGDAGVGADGSVALTPDGRTVLACTEAGTGSAGPRTANVSALAVATGSPLGVVHSWRHVDAAPCMITAAPSGGYLIVADISTHGIGIGLDLATGRSWQIGGGRPNPPLGLSW